MTGPVAFLSRKNPGVPLESGGHGNSVAHGLAHAHMIQGKMLPSASDASGPGDFGWNIFRIPALPLDMMEATMTDKKKTEENPELKDVEPGSDADASPVPKVGETPPNPNGNETDAEKDE
jgi:hypothetical protein